MGLAGPDRGLSGPGLRDEPATDTETRPDLAIRLVATANWSHAAETQNLDWG